MANNDPHLFTFVQMCLIRTFIVSFLITAITLPREVFHFVILLPPLIHHYHHEHENVSFNDFLKEHSGEVKHNGDDHHHDKLPFSEKSADRNPASFFIFYFTEYIKTITGDPVVLKTEFTKEFFKTEFFQSIWQPPKF